MHIACIPGELINANTYIISDASHNAVIIDPAESEDIISYLKKKELQPVAILLTHGHFDHISGIPAFIKEYPVPVYLHPSDALMLTDPDLNGLHVFYPHDPFEPIPEYIPVKHQQRLTLGELTFTVLSTPGHSEGSVCYFIRNSLFSGDTLFRGSYGRYDLWGGDKQKLGASLGRLLALDKAIKVYPGHGDMTTIGTESERYKIM